MARRVSLIALAVLITAIPPRADARTPRCQPADASPFQVVEQRLFRHHAMLVDDVVVVNVSPAAIDGVHVSVEFYSFFNELVRAERTVLTPPVLPPGGGASFRVATPLTQDARKIAYRFTGRRDTATFQSVVVCDADLQ